MVSRLEALELIETSAMFSLKEVFIEDRKTIFFLVIFFLGERGFETCRSSSAR